MILVVCLYSGLAVDREKLVHQSVVHLYSFISFLFSDLETLLQSNDAKINDDDFFKVRASLKHKFCCC